MYNVLLASQSPRRRNLIRRLGLPVQFTVAAVDEESIVDPDPATNAIKTALLKAEAVARRSDTPTVIIGADTIVALDREMLGKPAGPGAARQMLERLRGRTHQVHTGLALIDTNSGRRVTEISTTDVTMRNYSTAEIDAYVASGDPLDKAGAYAIQHQGFAPVARLEGCYTGVVGLSLCRLASGLGRLGVAVNIDAALQQHDYRVCATCRAMLASGRGRSPHLSTP
jgi:MAF protein